MSLRDQTTAQYFNQTGISVDLDISVAGDDFSWLSDVGTLARLTGAADNSRILACRDRSQVGSIILTVTNASVFKYPSEYVLFNDADSGELKLLLESMYLREELQRAGIGPRSVMISLLAAKDLGLDGVALLAAGSAAKRSIFVGYYVWPIIGFDAPVPLEKIKLLPDSLAGVTRLSDLAKSEEGRRWWYDNGSPMEVDFDLADGSVSWQLFHSYAKRKGICL